jgi:hypothetical protein
VAATARQRLVHLLAATAVAATARQCLAHLLGASARQTIILELRTRATDMEFFTSIRLQTTARQGSIQYMKSFNILLLSHRLKDLVLRYF